MSTRDMARTLIGAQAVVDEAGRHVKALRQRMLDEMGAGDRVTIKTDDGQELGKVLVTDPRPTARVVDGKALLAWVQANHPGEVVMMPTIRSSFRDALLAADGVDPTTGECIPGIEIVTGTPTVTVRPSDMAREIAAASMTGLPMIGGAA